GNEGVPQRRAPQRRPPHALTESVSRWPGNPGNVASSELGICAGPESMSEWSMRACRAGRPRRAPPAKVRAALYRGESVCQGDVGGGPDHAVAIPPDGAAG